MMTNNIIILSIFIGLLIFIENVIAQVPVTNFKRYVPAVPKVNYTFLKNIARHREVLEQLIEQHRPNKPVNFHLFPLIPHEISSGAVLRRVASFKNIQKPIFIIGSDQRSKKWLKHYADRLKTLHATGLLVQANSQQDWDDVNRLAPEVSIIPISGGRFSQQLGISHYPVLISKSLIEQ